MLQPFSQAENALRDTLITKAEGKRFDYLARWYGFPRPTGFTVGRWRTGLESITLAARGTPGVLAAFVEAIFAPGAFTVDIDPAQPQKITFNTAPGGLVAFAAEHTSRLWRIYSSLDGAAGRLYWSAGPDFSGGPASTYLTMATLGTAQWHPCNWGVLAAPETGVVAELLSWIAFDSLTNCEVDLLLEDTWSAPPTYLMIDNEAHPGPPKPYGGHLQVNQFSDGDQINGPFPPYLGGGDAPGIAEILKRLLAAGVHAKVRAVDFADMASLVI